MKNEKLKMKNEAHPQPLPAEGLGALYYTKMRAMAAAASPS